jgi:integrase
MGAMMRNPVDAVAPPRFEQREMESLDAKGVSALLSVAQQTDLNAPIVVAIGTGLRRGELLALRWSDLDLDAGRLSVRRSLETVKGVTRTKAPKTRRSARTVALPAFVVTLLYRERAAQLERHVLIGLGRDEDGWVFTRADGSPWEPGAFSLHFARLVKRSKLPHITFHGLRHSFTTLALASGVDLQTVSRALGHESVAITSRIYAHAVESLQQDAASRIDAHLSEAVNGASMSPLPGSVPPRCHARQPGAKKARRNGLSVVAPTGIEPVFAA